MTASEEANVQIAHESDIVAARREARRLASELSFTSGELAVIATAISEVSRNIASYAGFGTITVSIVEESGRQGIRVVASDDGPGIANIEAAMQDGYSTSNSLGLGLPGARRLMDEFTIESAPGTGTTIVMTKWAR